MKERFFEPKNAFSIIKFLALFKLACDSNNNLVGSSMWILPNYVKKTLSNALNSRMRTGNRISPFEASVRNEDIWFRKLFCSYPQVVICTLKKYATDQMIAENASAVLRYVQLSRMTPQQYVDHLIARPFKLDDVYNEGTLSDVFIKGLDASIKYSLRKYRVSNSQAHLPDIAFKVELLLSIQKGLAKNPNRQLPEHQSG